MTDTKYRKRVLTADLQKRGARECASLTVKVLNPSCVLLMKFSAENPHLRQSANR